MKKTRKTLLYMTGVEYGDYAINHVTGCAHGCLYPCYAFMMARRFGRVKDYDEWITPILVENAVEILEKEIPRLKDIIKTVQLCFTTDPFMFGYQNIVEMSLRIIASLDTSNIKCSVLTKGILPKQLAQFQKIHEWGISIISLNEEFRRNMEPNTAPYIERIDSLKYLHRKGYKTWVSIEPYPTPNIVEQDLFKLLNKVAFVDRIIFGRLHYNGLVMKYPDYQNFYNKAVDTVIAFCVENEIDYHIKAKTDIRL